LPAAREEGNLLIAVFSALLVIVRVLDGGLLVLLQRSMVYDYSPDRAFPRALVS